MRTVWEIIKSDLKKACCNPIAIFVLVGIMILPSLYAWVNIIANWDPYSNTNHLKIAVSSIDEGVDVSVFAKDEATDKIIEENVSNLNSSGVTNNNEINSEDSEANDTKEEKGKNIVVIGDLVIDQLKNNDQIDWVFVDRDDALDGVNKGKYYAAVIIPEDFSKNMFSILTPELEKPNIEYIINEKKNAVATKILDTVISKVQNEINISIVGVISEISANIINDGTEVLEDLENKTEDKKASAIATLKNANGDLGLIKDQMVILKSLLVSLQITNDNLQTTLPNLENDLNEIANNNGDTLALSQSIQKMGRATISAIGVTLDSVTTGLQSIEHQVEILGNTVDRVEQTQILSHIEADILNHITTLEGLKDTLKALILIYPDQADKINGLVNSLDSLIKYEGELAEFVESLSGEVEVSQSNLNMLNHRVDLVIKNIAGVRNTYHRDLEKSLEKVFANIDTGIGKVPGSIGQVVTIISSLEPVLGNVDKLLDSQISSFDSIDRILDKAISLNTNAISDIESSKITEKARSIWELFSNDPEEFASFMAIPVEVEATSLYPVANYGSAMTPFYTILAIWVGGLILVAVLKTNIKDPKFKDARLWQQFLGRYVIFLLLAIGQGVIVALGDLYILKVQCYSDFVFILTCVLASVSFITIIYTLTIVFGAVGKAIAVIALVLQVAGSGGTFPSELMPTFFINVNAILPFTYGINALRECIGGFYDGLYLYNLKYLMFYFIPFIVIGILIRPKVYDKSQKFKQKMKETGFM